MFKFAIHPMHLFEVPQMMNVSCNLFMYVDVWGNAHAMGLFYFLRTKEAWPTHVVFVAVVIMRMLMIDLYNCLCVWGGRGGDTCGP